VHLRGHRHGGDGDPARPDGPLARAGVPLHRPRCAEQQLPMVESGCWLSVSSRFACHSTYVRAKWHLHLLSWLRLLSRHVRSGSAGALLKEAIDDLEWAAAGGHQSARSAVHLVLRRDPKALTLFAKGAGELKVRPLDRRIISSSLSRCHAECESMPRNDRHVDAPLCCCVGLGTRQRVSGASPAMCM